MLPIFRGFDRLLLTEDCWQYCTVIAWLLADDLWQQFLCCDRDYSNHMNEQLAMD